MKFKDSKIRIYFDYLSNSFRFNFEGLKVKKVTSRMFPMLLGKNQYNGVGYAVLDRVGLLAFEKIDPFYMIRGDIAEIITRDYLEFAYKKAGFADIEVKRFTPVQVKFDMFPKNEKFGGVVDVAISSPEAKRAVIECKSKNMKYYDEYVRLKNFPEEEIMQGKFLRNLSKVKRLLMAYIFFEDELEERIKKSMKAHGDNVSGLDVIKDLGLTFSSKGIKIHIEPFEYDEIEYQKTTELMERAYDNLHRIIGQGQIHKKHFNENELYILDQIIRDSDLPF